MQPDYSKAPEVVEARDLAARTTSAVQGYKITTAAQYEEGASVLRRIKAGQKRLEELRTAITGPLNAALRAVNDLFRTPGTELDNAERAVKREMTAFQTEQERLAREEQRKLDEAAQRERDRLAAEQRQKEQEAEQLRQQAEAARNAGNTAEAAKLETKAERKEDRAADLGSRADTIVAPVITREPPKVAGVATREIWKAECTDLMALVKAIAAGHAPLSLVVPNDKVIGQQARSLQHDFKVPGVRVWSEKSIAAGAA